MAQRITITIPDSLHERLQAVKDRINVSGICQEAIIQAVCIEEVRVQSTPEMESLLERLQKEKEQYFIGSKNDGIQDGMEDALSFHFRDFVSLEELATRFPHMAESIGRYDYPALKNRLKQKLDDKSHHPGLYSKGWVEGILRIWAELKTKMELPEVEPGAKALEGDPIRAQVAGVVELYDVFEGKSMRSEMNPTTKTQRKVITCDCEHDLRPRIELLHASGKAIKFKDADRRYFLPAGTILMVKKGDQVSRGDVLAIIPKVMVETPRIG
ncbi:MAG: hypothetical protein ABSF90_23410 [Syntrophobacteraceae bacterium]|jgi:hypothetical protein